MNEDLTPLLTASIAFAYVGGIGFLVAGIYLSWRRRRLHPLLLVCISAARDLVDRSALRLGDVRAVPAGDPADAVVVARQHDLGWACRRRCPSATSSYFVLPAVIGAALGNRASARFGWRRPIALLTVGFGVGFVWALLFNAMLGARLGVFYYGRVIPGLAIFEGTKHQYPIYDAMAMALQMMVFAYLLGRTDAEGRNLIEVWADSRTKSRLWSSLLSVVGVVLVGHVLYLAVFAPHLATKLMGDVTSGPTEQLFPGVENQPLHGGMTCTRPRSKDTDDHEPSRSRTPLRPLRRRHRRRPVSDVDPPPRRGARCTGTRSTGSGR